MARRRSTAEHEPAEFAARRIASLGAGLLASVAILSTTILAVVHRPHSAERNAVGGADVPSPRLQVAPIDDYAHYLAQKRAQLDSTGWIDREHGIAHIPIEQAMDDIAKKDEAVHR